MCGKGFYLNFEQLCLACPFEFRTCIENKLLYKDVECTACRKGFEIINQYCDPICGEFQYLANYSCLCITGYKLDKTKCVPDYFNLTISVNHENRIFLNFDAEPNSTYDLQNFTLTW